MSVSLSSTAEVPPARQIPPTEDKAAPRGADATFVTSRRSSPSTSARRPGRAWAYAAAGIAAAALPSSAAAGPGSGSGAWVWVLAAAGAAVLVLTLLRLRAHRSGGRIGIADIADGRQILTTLREKRRDVMATQLSRLTPTDQQTLIQLLQRLAED